MTDFHPQVKGTKKLSPGTDLKHTHSIWNMLMVNSLKKTGCLLWMENTINQENYSSEEIMHALDTLGEKSNY